MTTRMPFYRSPVTRWGFIVTAAFLAVAFSPVGPVAWRDTPSLEWLHNHYLPWPILSSLFVADALVHCVRHVDAAIIGCGLGLVLYGWEFVALCATTRPHRPTNPFIIAAVLLAMVLYFAALRLAIIQKSQEAT